MLFRPTFLLIATLLLCLNGVSTAIDLPDETPTLERVRKWAAAGDVRSKHDLGVLYLKGIGVAQDFDRAKRYFREAASLGDTPSMYNLGEMYTRGIGVEPDYDKATEWFTRAASAGADLDASKFATLYYDVVLPAVPDVQEPPPVEIVPIPAPEAPSTRDEVIREVTRFVENWAAAWSGQDVPAYLDAYAASFVPPSPLSRNQWERQRQSRLRAPAWIRIDISEPQIRLLDHGWVRVDFEQQYESSIYRDRVRKTLMLRRQEGGWHIVAEQSRPLD